MYRMYEAMLVVQVVLGEKEHGEVCLKLRKVMLLT